MPVDIGASLGSISAPPTAGLSANAAAALATAGALAQGSPNASPTTSLSNNKGRGLARESSDPNLNNGRSSPGPIKAQTVVPTAVSPSLPPIPRENGSVIQQRLTNSGFRPLTKSSWSGHVGLGGGVAGGGPGVSAPGVNANALGLVGAGPHNNLIPGRSAQQRYPSEPPGPYRHSSIRRGSFAGQSVTSRGMGWDMDFQQQQQQQQQFQQQPHQPGGRHFRGTIANDFGFAAPRPPMGMRGNVRRPSGIGLYHEAPGGLLSAEAPLLAAQEYPVSASPVPSSLPNGSRTGSKASPASKFRGVEELAKSLVEQCGSLERAFTSFDYNRQKKFSRTPFETGLLVLHLDCEELCGVTAKQLFKMMDTQRGRPTGDVTIECWNAFFEKMLKDTDFAYLLTEDLGAYGGRNFKRGGPGGGENGDPLCSDGEENERRSRPGSVQRVQAPRIDSRRPSRTGIDNALAPPSAEEVARRLSRDASPQSQEGSIDRSHSPNQLRLRGTQDYSHIASRLGVGRGSQQGSRQGSKESTTQGPPPRSARQPQDHSQMAPNDSDSSLDSHCADPDKSRALPSLHNAVNERMKRRTPEPNADGGAAPTESGASCGTRVNSANGPTDGGGGLEDEEDLDEAALRERLARVAPSKALQMALEGDFSLLHELSEDELAAVAEQQQLEDELKELDLSGIKALAYVLAAKCGSVKRAFKWFDMNRKGRIAQFTWDTGVHLLRIHMKRLTGFESTEIFQMMDIDPRDGLISKSEWKTFFAAVDDGTLMELLRKAAGDPSEQDDLVHRSAGRRDDLFRRLGAGRGGDRLQPPSARRSLNGDTGRTSSRERNGGRSAREWEEDRPHTSGPTERSSRRMSEGRSGGSAQDSDDEAARRRRQGGGGRGDDAENGGRGRSGLDSAGAGGAGTSGNDSNVDSNAQTASRATEQVFDPEAFKKFMEDFREKVRRELSQLSLNQHQEYESMAPWQKSIVHEVAKGFELYSVDTEYGCWVCDCLDFVAEVRETLVQLPSGGTHEFSFELCPNQNRAIHFVCKEFSQLSAFTEIVEGKRRVVVFNMPNFAEEVRKALSALRPGDSKIFLQNLTAPQKRLVHLIAAEMKLWSHETTLGEATGLVEVVHLQSFAKFVREKLEALQKGEEYTFQPALSEAQIKIVHKIALELGLVPTTIEEKKTYGVLVGHCSAWRDEMRALLEGLAPGDTRTFSDLSKLQRAILTDLVNELGFMIEAPKSKKPEDMQVKRPLGNNRRKGSKQSVASGGGDDDADKKDNRGQSKESGGGDLDWDSLQGASTANLMSRLFFQYATGMFNGERIFLRFPDLRKFAEDAKGLAPESHRMFCQFEGILESTFEDTIQLQSDMGTKTTKGLTLQWFQVFVQKALTRLGLQIVSLLMALLTYKKK